MTKRTLIAYTVLFLFAFTFGLSFTVTQKAQAEPPQHECCIISYCPQQPWNVAMMGHWWEIEPGVRICVQNQWPPLDECDMVFECAE